ncbi:aspartyl-phosphate phosphatase Spo0E family protein [Paenibacillus sp. 1781tsa1]|uniref:aspartyl-phosphate phosphatase Spo0E family protein n=1 Tax=unclassified Paenibacillus TaxID=185978 RepID=UPI00209CF5E4|nr:aspartyl-phosphate phosphatase Spo0E family protein [Paenibacillus sp. 1781tsa1]MCP1187313.1 aspartyl-phosphate phosphatase Spo0E family protein [Paenibacillus sp. 1781tsa1]
MVMSLDLKNKIEKARRNLYVLVEHNKGGLGHPDVIRQSMALDELINEYNRISRNHSRA